MKIQIASDLHLERADVEIKNAGARVLVLAGDIMCAKFLDKKSPDSNSILYRRFTKFLDRVSDEFQDVVYVAGNHEFYGFKWQKTLDVLADHCSKYSNVDFLEASAVTLEDVTFVGGTLWTDLRNGDPFVLHDIRSLMNDYRAILDDTQGHTKLKPITPVMRHKRTLKVFSEIIAQDPASKYVVVGHHAPSFQSVPDEYRHEFTMNSAYATDLSEFILDRPQIKAWIHGHMHDPVDYKIGETRILANPRGYLGYETRANTWHGSELVVEI
jgi:predicted phosphodiesterase